ncbi:hypothetical protein RvY_12219 [Ramazzottius varieornatus]|uniref:Vesicular, overexpressed in cancer, prosurvival protein 1 n=1 Tax=Ramazzottius varieornatus TaxID=947166 RepID=A0A1D1VIU5_RAMVA|nr:hypothetical protein RvY_12219 [Ramazzottius varieornatus]
MDSFVGFFIFVGIAVVLCVIAAIIRAWRHQEYHRRRCHVPPTVCYTPSSTCYPTVPSCSTITTTYNSSPYPAYPPPMNGPMVVSPRPFMDAPPNYDVAMTNP